MEYSIDNVIDTLEDSNADELVYSLLVEKDEKKYNVQIKAERIEEGRA